MTNVAELIQSENLEGNLVQNINGGFSEFLAKLVDWKQAVEQIQVKDENDTDSMKQARILRLTIKASRTEADKVRKDLKDATIRYGRAVQTVYNRIEDELKPLESRLQQLEDFGKIAAEQREAKLRLERQQECQPYSKYVPASIDLAKLTEDEYSSVLSGAKLQHQNELRQAEEAKKAEQERLERERQEREEAERKRQAELAEAKQRAEAEAKARAKAEAARKAAEEKAKKEREAIQAKLDAERKQRMEAEAEAREKAEAEAAKMKSLQGLVEDLQKCKDRSRLHDLSLTAYRHISAAILALTSLENTSGR